MTAHGIHHVTAIAGDAGRNLGFYTRRLGLRLVKRTVNFDDPGTHHLYFGDAAGSPGTIATFFPWAGAPRGQPGAGEVAETAFRVPRAALEAWAARLDGAERSERFGEPVLLFADDDGARLALVGVPDAEAEPAWSAAVPAAEAVRGLHGVRLCVADPAATEAVLTDVFGFARAGTEGGASRLRAPGVALGAVVDLLPANGAGAARLGRGSVHHLAFRAADDAAQAAIVARLAGHGLRTTEQKDRDYFRSVYFREPGGVLFEIATDIPGFAVDEAPNRLGGALQLPRFLRSRRREIEAALPSLDLPIASRPG